MASSSTERIDLSSEQSPFSFSRSITPHIKLPEPQKAINGRKRPESIRVPDLFSSILSVKAVVNPHYLAVKEEGDEWYGDVMEWDEKARKKNSAADLAYLAAIWSPESDADSLRVIVDWNHWIFNFDDRRADNQIEFDEGDLRDDLPAAQAEVAANVAIMKGTAPRYSADATEHRLKLRHVFQTCCDRLRQGAQPALVQRFQEQQQRYFTGVLDQVEEQASGRALTKNIDEFIKTRRGTVGVYPAITLCEWSEGIELGSEPFEHPSLQQCMVVGTDLTWLVNDVVSFRKDLALGTDDNLISLLMEQGRSMQEAVDKIGDMAEDCYRCWYLALAELPIWGAVVDHEALRFVDICRNLALGNLHWSFKTGRYLGVEGDELRKTRIMHLPPQE